MSRSSLIAKQKLRERLGRIPVIKLPPSKLEPSLKELTSVRTDRREEIIDRIVTIVYPKSTVKLAFRALVAPTLTRLHFARSDPPAFRSAPNARLWKAVGDQDKKSYVSLVLFDFAAVKLQLDETMFPPRGSLRAAARQLDDVRLVDRVRGLDHMLDWYLSPAPKADYYEQARTDYFADRPEELRKIVKAALPVGRITAIDEARYRVMENMLGRKILASSFVVDEWLKIAIRSMEITALRSVYPGIESLIMSGRYISALMLRAAMEEPSNE